MRGASFDGMLNADALQVGGMLLMRSAGQNLSSFKGVHLLGATIKGQIDMVGAKFDDTLDAESVQTGSDLLMRGARFANEVVMASALVGGGLDLRGAYLLGLDLSRASVARDLRLGGELGALNLRNAHVGNLIDAKSGWPAHGQVNLDGFTFEQLSEFDREIDWWTDWLRLGDYRPGLYAQVAAALTNSGDRYAANEIRYAYGIVPPVLFRILYWVLGLSLTGAVLWRTVPAANMASFGFWRQLVTTVACDPN
jgi:hypothetical protein